MRVFFDFEFVSLENPAPISVGLTAADDAHLYAELAEGWRPEDCTEFTRAHVLPLLAGDARPRSEVVAAIGRFLAPYSGGELICDSAHDKRCFGRVFGPPPDGWVFRKCAYTLNSYGASYFASGLRPHHAGDDSKALKALVLAKLAAGEDYVLLEDF